MALRMIMQADIDSHFQIEYTIHITVDIKISEE